MNYQEARRVRGTSLKDLTTQNIVSGQGFVSSFGSAISDRFKAKSIGIKEKFDPLNVARKLTGSLGAAVIGRLTGRNQKDIEYFTGKRARGSGSRLSSSGSSMSGLDNRALFTKVSEGQNPKLKKGDSLADILAKMLNFMKKTHDEEIKAMELARDFAKNGITNTQVAKTATMVTPTATKEGEKAKEESPDTTSWLKSLLMGLGRALTTLGLIYAALKDLLSPFGEFFNKFKFNLRPNPKAGDSKNKPGGRNKNDGKNNNKNNGKTTPAEEPNKPVTPSNEPENKPGFNKTAEDKIRERAARMAKMEAAKRLASKYSVEMAKKRALGALFGPLNVAVMAYEVADFLAPTEQEALDTHVETLKSIEEDITNLELDKQSGKISQKEYDIAYKGQTDKAAVVQEKIKVLKDKAETDTYKMEAQLNNESADLSLAGQTRRNTIGIVEDVKNWSFETDPLTQFVGSKLFGATQENQKLKLDEKKPKVIINDNSKTSVTGTGGKSAGLSIDESQPVRASIERNLAILQQKNYTMV
jgi:hypothetical protein